MTRAATIHELTTQESDIPEYFVLDDKKEWQVKLDTYETIKGMSNEPLLLMHFTIIETGKYFGYPLVRYYKVDKLTQKPQKGGNFKAKKVGAFITDFCNVTSTGPKRLDRIPMTLLENIIIMVSVRTKTLQHDGTEHVRLPDLLHHSVVDKMLRTFKP